MKIDIEILLKPARQEYIDWCTTNKCDDDNNLIFDEWLYLYSSRFGEIVYEVLGEIFNGEIE